ncbi:hypothetical protein JZ751_000434 [Albula glossodonta]|uniref:Uncharacterized protein n=1 Tax=Albula glossodonta TaxID=121402 RepID=A0A8T2PWK5_9TELE|nr:hypothetical protein JZ751_000434 [Albula glossodonta]
MYPPTHRGRHGLLHMSCTSQAGAPHPSPAPMNRMSQHHEELTSTPSSKIPSYPRERNGLLSRAETARSDSWELPY